MNEFLLSSIRTKIIFITLLVFVLVSMASVNAADNLTDNVIASNDFTNEPVSLKADSVEPDSISDEADSNALVDDSAVEIPNEDEILEDSNLEDGTLTDLFDDINGCTGNEYKLKRNYVYNVSVDDYVMPINKNNFTIDGQGHSIDGGTLSNLLYINGTNITLKNINFIHGSAYPLYGFRNLIESVYINGTGTVKNCNFSNGIVVAALGFEDLGFVDNCSFTDNAGEINTGGILFRKGGVVNHSSFVNNLAVDGGAMYTKGNLLIENSYVKSNYASLGSHVFFAEDGANVTVINVTPSYSFGKSFKDLSNVIKSGQNIKLIEDYMYVERLDDRGNQNYQNGIEITKDNMVIDGQGHSISGEGLARIFKITANNVTLKNINFFNGYSDGDGGAICLAGRKLSMIIENCSFTNNIAKGNGGAVFGNATIKNSIFTNNTAGLNGGAVSCTIGNVLNCVFSNGVAKNGGGIYATEITCINSSFENNNAQEYAGGMYAVRDTIEGCQFNNNTALYGGAFYSDELATVKNSAFSFNNARVDGGAGLFNHFSPNDDIVDNCTFNDNVANGNGGAISSDSPCLKVANSKFSRNGANDGGALYLKNGGDLDHCDFDGNTAKNEGDAICSLKDLNINSNTFKNGNINDSNLIVLKNGAKIIE